MSSHFQTHPFASSQDSPVGLQLKALQLQAKPFTGSTVTICSIASWVTCWVRSRNPNDVLLVFAWMILDATVRVATC